MFCLFWFVFFFSCNIPLSYAVAYIWMKYVFTPHHLFGRAIAELICNLLPPSGLHFLGRELNKKLLQFFLLKKKRKEKKKV